MRLQRYGKDRSRDVRNNTLASADNTINDTERIARNNTLASTDNAIARYAIARKDLEM